MSYDATIPRHDEDLYITDDTEKAEVDAFVRSRLEKPAVLNDVVVFNFSGFTLDGTALVNAASDLDGGVYVIPYQVPGTWGYMVDVLPPEVSDAPLLTYRREEGEYHAYTNWRDADEEPEGFREAYESVARRGGERP